MDEIIYGKNNVEYIVNAEVIDDQIELYRELPDGTNDVQYLPNRFWILAPYQIDEGWQRLGGNLHYKWGKQYKTKSEFFTDYRLYNKFDIFRVYHSVEAAMLKDGFTYYKGLQSKNVSVLSIDIEATGFVGQGSKVLLISNTYRRGDKTISKLFSYDEYESEGDMLLDWCAWVREVNPSIILGHNINSYDLPFLKEVADREEIDLNLGRDESAMWMDDYESKFRKDGSQFYNYNRSHIFGREIIDTMFLAIKYDAVERKYINYRLKDIIKQEGLEKADRVFYDAATIKDNYQKPEEWAKIKEYCRHDSEDALMLYDLMISPFFYMSQSIPKTPAQINQGASGAQLNALLIRSYLQNKHSIPRADEMEKFEAAISEGYPGIYHNCFKVDISSLYPSIILQWELNDKNKDPNANFLYITKTFTELRFKYKKLFQETKNKDYDHLQNTFKILINSLYGLCGANGLNFNCRKNAMFITEKGRDMLNIAINWCKEKEFKLANCDTDSILFSKADMSEITKDEQDSLLADLNSKYPEKIRMANDGYFPTAVILKAKNYALWDGKKLKTKGSALKSSTKELALREMMQEVIQSIMDKKYNYMFIYHKYIYKCMHIENKEEMKLWSSKKTITSKVLNPKRTNEQKVLDALEGEEDLQEGNKIWVFFKEDESLCLVDNFNGEYDKYRLVKKVWNTLKVFDAVLDLKQFPKYHLIKQRDLISKIEFDKIAV